MTAAGRATMSATRANIAAAHIRRGHTSGRAFAACFECGDGDTVVASLLGKAATDPRIMAYAVRAGWNKTHTPPAQLNATTREG